MANWWDAAPVVETTAPEPTPPAAPTEPDKPELSGQEQFADVFKSGVAGAGRGAIQGVGTGGDLRELIKKGAEKAGIVDPATVDKLITAFGVVGGPIGNIIASGPTSKNLQEKVEGVTGEFHEPQTTAGKFAGTAGEFVGNPLSYVGPGGLGAKALQAASAGLGSEAAGQMFEGEEGEGAARVAGAVAGGFGPRGISKAITPLTTNPERQALVNTLRQEGIQPTAGQATGSKALQYSESMFGDALGAGNKATHATERAGEQFTRANTRHIGQAGERATSDVIDDTFANLSREMDGLAARNVMQVDMPFFNDINLLQRDYRNLLKDPLTRPQVEGMYEMAFNQINASLARGSPLPGAVYQSARTTLDGIARGAQNSELKRFAYAMKSAYDEVMNRSIQALNPADAGAWRAAQRQYRNLIPISRASGAGSAAEGILTPAQMRQALKAQSRRGYERGRGDLAGVTRAADAILKPLPNSGTAQRNALTAGMAGVGGLAGAGGTGDTSGGISGAAIGAIMSPIAGRALMSRPAQRYLGNQAMSNVIRRLPQSRYRTGMVGTAQELQDEEE